MWVFALMECQQWIEFYKSLAMPHVHDHLKNKQFTFKSIDPQNACMHFFESMFMKKALFV